MQENSTLYNQKNTSAKDKNNNRRFVVWTVIVILSITNIFLLVRVLENEKKVTRQDRVIASSRIEKDALLGQLKEEKAQFEKMRKENSWLSGQLSEKNTEIRSKIAEIEKLLQSGDEAQLKKAKAELASLRSMNNRYIAEITTLKKQNTELTTAKLALEADLSSERTRVTELSQQNEVLTTKVSSAALLRTRLTEFKAMKVKSGGREVEVKKASKARNIKFCGTILGNSLAEKGSRSLYLRLIGPDGSTLGNATSSITVNNATIPVTQKQEIFYDNQDTDYCFYFSKGTKFEKGTYAAELYMDGRQVAFTRLKLE